MLSQLDNLKAIVLDFDCTITREHTGGRAGSPDRVSSEYIKNNTKSGFQEFVRQVVLKDIAIYIATYGDDSFATAPEELAGHALIQHYMECLFGTEQTIFHAPERDAEGEITRYHNVIAKFSGDRKAFHWDIILRQLKGEVGVHEVLFLDDGIGNIEYAQELGCQCIVTGTAAYAASISADERIFDLLKLKL